MFATALKSGLELMHGINVTHCASLEAAKAEFAVAAEAFSLAVVDLNLPDAPNCEALEFVLAGGVPVIVFTATFNDRTRDQILERGVIDCVIKNEPESIGRLIAAVDRALTNGRTTVMLVDSNKASRLDLAGILRRQRLSVIEVTEAGEALQMFDAGETIDVIVTDTELADMAGADLLDEVRKRQGEYAVPVIGLSEHGDARLAARFIEAGGADFLRKPFLEAEFSGRVRHAATLQKRIQALRRAAASDYLTDIFNRRHFFLTGPRLVEQYLRRGEGTSIAVLDIDHFKRLNDTYGHEIGDLVLKHVARRLKALVGEEHLLARLGGEEFGILFDGLDVRQAFAFCERLRAELAKAKIVADDEELTITVSIGLATIEAPESFENYLHAADQFLYMAKHAGRNRVMSELALLDALAS
ncbi:diguanylate cyclase [Sinorhizobium numidicum]|uniref:diguanylate cyclase n=1 Tax=Sinorhizobium numidicum TaxID=680248 RepID=A0ABY8CVV8_9HYPH|nr:diguanylate cyclase [Sinorhizobium numidicum]WEX76117.1 diguanylate cyclase [Sinorhizobium numidicum]WEX82776.1 diguanylate cyclase [Sinorhizobium numidicum]